jgi:hypothetical protein
MRPELERAVIEWSSVPIAILICGSVAPEVRIPVKEAVSEVYKGIKTAGRELRRLIYYNDNQLSY